MHRLAAQHHSAGEGLAPGANRVRMQERDDFRRAARFRLSRRARFACRLSFPFPVRSLVR
jgi:hypothetical protein